MTEADVLRLVLNRVVAVVAVLGLVLGLVNLVYTWRTSRSRLAVSLNAGVITPSMQTVFILSVRNVGRQPVTLSSVGVDLRDEGDTDERSAARMDAILGDTAVH